MAAAYERMLWFSRDQQLSTNGHLFTSHHSGLEKQLEENINALNLHVFEALTRN